MPTTHDHLIRRLTLQDALLKRHAERSLRAYLEQAWPILAAAVIVAVAIIIGALIVRSGKS